MKFEFQRRGETGEIYYSKLKRFLDNTKLRDFLAKDLGCALKIKTDNDGNIIFTPENKEGVIELKWVFNRCQSFAFQPELIWTSSLLIREKEVANFANSIANVINISPPFDTLYESKPRIVFYSNKNHVLEEWRTFNTFNRPDYRVSENELELMRLRNERRINNLNIWREETSKRAYPTILILKGLKQNEETGIVDIIYGLRLILSRKENKWLEPNDIIRRNLLTSMILVREDIHPEMLELFEIPPKVIPKKYNLVQKWTTLSWIAEDFFKGLDLNKILKIL